MKSKVDQAASAAIDESVISNTLETGKSADGQRIREILSKARELTGLTMGEVAALTTISDPELMGELFSTAHEVKETIYGRRMVLFAPLYISNLCGNECLYCAFRARNTDLKRRALTQEEIAEETGVLIRQGHKRVLLVAGEAYPRDGFQYVLDSIRTVYDMKFDDAGIRRINVNVAPLYVDQFRALKDAKIGTYQLFQETYHRETYAKVHAGGKKRDYDWRVSCMDRAMEGGIDDVGIGVLFGLFDWRFELLALMQHIGHLEAKYGVGPHTISVPRLEPASGSEIAYHPPFAVSDVEFRKLVAILRLAVPYTGIILSTRESVTIRRETFALGISQISAGSRTNPYGYSSTEREDMEQFCLNDHRPLDEVVRDLSQLGFIPSFCTGCYRLGRTGEDFMDLAKPGQIRKHCDPNAASTFVEYLEDYASKETKTAGEAALKMLLAEMEDLPRKRAETLVSKVRKGDRDVYC
jgi:2-iminoacetate synthase